MLDVEELQRFRVQRVICSPLTSLGTCGNITSFARNPDGTIMTCRYIYKNVTTSLPFFYWSRFPQNDNAGYFSEAAYTGQGIVHIFVQINNPF